MIEHLKNALEELYARLEKFAAVVEAAKAWREVVITKGSEAKHVASAEQEVFKALAALEEEGQ